MNRAACHTVLVTLATAACSQPRTAAPSVGAECALSVIAGLRTTPDEQTLAELGRTSGATITLERAMTAPLYLLKLTATGTNAACDAALERLRRDPRVSSAERDEQRRIAGP